MQIIEEDAARKQGLSKYFSGKPCRRGHLSERYVSTGACLVCLRTTDKILKDKDPEKQRVYLKEYHSKRKITHAEEIKIKGSLACKKWRETHPDRATARTRNRELAKIQRTPFWADKNKILEFYTLSQKLTDATGIRHHVDHIIPLRGKLVSGLHVPANLQVLTGKENLTKSSKFNIEEYNAKTSLRTNADLFVSS